MQRLKQIIVLITLWHVLYMICILAFNSIQFNSVQFNVQPVLQTDESTPVKTDDTQHIHNDSVFTQTLENELEVMAISRLISMIMPMT